MAARLSDTRDIEACHNKMGNEFKNWVGNLDAIWANGNVTSTLRVQSSRPRKTCTDGFQMQYYILEEPRQISLIDAAIHKNRREVSKETAKDSKF
jgi:hypothetical protein